MSGLDMERLAVEAKRDQAWAMLADSRCVAEVSRIAECGPNGSERDAKICQMVCNLLMGELGMRLIEACDGSEQ